ncbi:MAG TPA: hypothetical protein VMB50_21055 [Myxococcales bacterium]|nr:hypothetical protein [Myxococcales bacterium]
MKISTWILCGAGLVVAQSAVARAAEPLERYYEERVAAAEIYRAPPQAIVPSVEQTLSSAGYSWSEGAPSRLSWQTDWRCSGDRCDRLTITLEPTRSGTGVAIVRTRREGATDSQIVWQSPAGDVEWALLERLDPSEARRVEAGARRAQKM